MVIGKLVHSKALTRWLIGCLIYIQTQHTIVMTSAHLLGGTSNVMSAITVLEAETMGDYTDKGEKISIARHM